jgi:hypothetical protein
LVSLVWPPARGVAANRAVSSSGVRRYSAINIYTVYFFLKHFARKKQTGAVYCKYPAQAIVIDGNSSRANFGMKDGANDATISARLATSLLAWQVCVTVARNPRGKIETLE